MGPGHPPSPLPHGFAGGQAIDVGGLQSLSVEGGEDPPQGREEGVLTSILVVLVQAGAFRALYEEHRVDKDAWGALPLPGRSQRHLEVHPGLAQRHKGDGEDASQRQHQAGVACDPLGVVQQSPADGEQQLLMALVSPETDCPCQRLAQPFPGPVPAPCSDRLTGKKGRPLRWLP